MSIRHTHKAAVRRKRAKTAHKTHKARVRKARK